MEIGQEVYLEESVAYGWGRNKIFTIKGIVEKATRTQFTVNGRRFRKSDGLEIGRGCYSRAKLKGVDQTREMNKFEDKVNLRNKIYVKSGTISLPIDCDIEDMCNVYEMLCIINKITEKWEK